MSVTGTDQHTLVSVVMATYVGDRPAYLRKAVESILAQTFRNVELVIVVNGTIGLEASTYLAGLHEKEARVRVIELESNYGPSHARNEGVRAARGSFIAIMDADDIAAPERIERQLAFLHDTDADVAGSFYYIIDEQGKITGRKEVPVTPEEIRKWLHIFSPLSNPTVIARAEILKENQYQCEFQYSEDYNLWIRLIRKGYVLRNQPEYLFYYRQEKNFFRKRRGWTFFVSDLRNKMSVLSLHPFHKRPYILIASLVTLLSRFMPAPLLRFVYGLRNALSFHASKQ